MIGAASRKFALLVAILFLVGGCASTGSDGRLTMAAAEPTSAPVDTERTGSKSESQTGSDNSTAVDEQASESSETSDTEESGTTKGTDKEDGIPRSLDFPHETKLRMTATVAPLCASPGDEMTLKVTAPPEAGIVWQAVYSDDLGGADPPFGGGYGGNDKGYADEDGRYESSWTISPTAPAGAARVDVIGGHRAKWGYEKPRFAVADAKGRCPQKWLKGGGQ